MYRSSTDAQYLADGTVVLDADGIPVPVDSTTTGRAVMKAADAAAARAAIGAAADLDTGRRNILSLLTVTPTGGTVTLQRVGHTCLLNILGLTFPASGSGSVGMLPTGFLPAETVATTMRGVSDVFQITAAGNLQIYAYTTGRIDGSLMWISRNPWPSTLPGNPL